LSIFCGTLPGLAGGKAFGRALTAARGSLGAGFTFGAARRARARSLDFGFALAAGRFAAARVLARGFARTAGFALDFAFLEDLAISMFPPWTGRVKKAADYTAD
jgi:hypothetical protein